MKERIYLFDTTLRDGQQTPGIDFSVEDKIAIANLLDELPRTTTGKIDYPSLEAKFWPGSAGS